MASFGPREIAEHHIRAEFLVCDEISQILCEMAARYIFH